MNNENVYQVCAAMAEDVGEVIFETADEGEALSIIASHASTCDDYEGDYQALYVTECCAGIKL